MPSRELFILCTVYFLIKQPILKFNEGVVVHMTQKFDFTALRNHKPKTPIILKEKNKPNLDRMAEAFHKLFSF
jgi:hypothetical protein